MQIVIVRRISNLIINELIAYKGGVLVCDGTHLMSSLIWVWKFVATKGV